MTMIGLSVLGPPQVLDADGVRPVPRGRQQQVLGHLVARRGEVVRSERLAEALWPRRRPQDPANALQYVIARLRRLLEPTRVAGQPPRVLVTSGGGYRLDLPAERIDAVRLQEVVSRTASWPDPSPGDVLALDEVIASWRGGPWADFPDDLVLAGEARRLRSVWFTALVAWADRVVDDAEGAALVVGRLSEVATHDDARLHEGIHLRLADAHRRRGDVVTALEVLDEVDARLADELGLDPGPDLQAMRLDLLRRSVPSPGVPADRPPPRPLPPAPVDRFFGRRSERGRLAGLLDPTDRNDPAARAPGRSRLVTLTGPSGIGKSRLALEVAHDLVDDLPGGVVWVALGRVAAPAPVALAVAAATALNQNVGRDLVHVLAEHLEADATVLVLDDAERRVADVGMLARTLLQRAPSLRILVTSQRRLGVRGETVVGLDALPVPDPEDPNAGDDAEQPDDRGDDLPVTDAVAMFLDRARALDPGMVVDSATMAATSRLVRAVDGLPLAIELAAGRTRVLTIDDLADRLATTLDVLAPGGPDRPDHHHTLGAALDWSLDLLAAEDRRVLERLAVVADFDLATAEALGDLSSLDQLARLVDRSWLKHDPDTNRYRTLSSLRTHVWSRLEPATAGEIFDRFLAWVVDLVATQAARLRGPRQREAMAILDRERATITMALQVATRQDGGRLDLDRAQRIVWEMGRYWDWRGEFAEAGHWATTCLDLVDDRGCQPLDGLLAWAAFSALETGHVARADALVERSLRRGWIERDTGAPGGLIIRTVLRRRTGDLEGSIADARIVLDTSVHRGSSWGRGWANDALAHAHAAAGEVVRARTHADRALAAFRESGDERGVAWARNGLADANRAAGDLAACRAAAELAAVESADLGDRRSHAWALELLATAIADREPDRALVLLGAVGWLRATPWAATASDVHPLVGDLRDRLGDDHGNELFAHGRHQVRHGSTSWWLDRVHLPTPDGPSSDPAPTDPRPGPPTDRTTDRTTTGLPGRDQVADESSASSGPGANR